MTTANHRFECSWTSLLFFVLAFRIFPQVSVFVICDHSPSPVPVFRIQSGVEAAFSKLGGQDLYVEEWADFDKELAVMVGIPLVLNSFVVVDVFLCSCEYDTGR